MKAYLNNGITIEGTVAEIKEFLEGQHYTITTTPNTTPVWFYPSQPLDPKYNKFEITCSTTDINNKQYHHGTRRINAICSMTSI